MDKYISLSKDLLGKEACLYGIRYKLISSLYGSWFILSEDANLNGSKPTDTHLMERYPYSWARCGMDKYEVSFKSNAGEPNQMALLRASKAFKTIQ